MITEDYMNCSLGKIIQTKWENKRTIMFNYEWQKYIKDKYLNLAHALQMPYHGDKQVILSDIKAAKELIVACEKYIAEQKTFIGDLEE